MSKYRIIEHENPNGRVEYEAQKKILGSWWDLDRDGVMNIFYRTFFRTFKEAEMAIQMNKKELHIKKIINVE